MSVHSMLTNCNECGEEFYIDIEYDTSETLKDKAENTVCPKCGSKNWFMTDACER